ncbi:MAG TPA: hypothetical protein VK507_20940 [Iamia sp.]|nr:hypothetical protein [Iamia sp.]
MHPTELRPTPSPGRRAAAHVASVLVLLASVVAALALVAVGFNSALCGDSGECAPGEESRGGWLMLLGPVVFLATPVLVAIARRDGRWLLAPVAMVAVMVAVGLLVALGASL